MRARAWCLYCIQVFPECAQFCWVWHTACESLIFCMSHMLKCESNAVSLPLLPVAQLLPYHRAEANWAHLPSLSQLSSAAWSPINVIHSVVQHTMNAYAICVWDWSLSYESVGSNLQDFSWNDCKVSRKHVGIYQMYFKKGNNLCSLLKCTCL